MPSCLFFMIDSRRFPAAHGTFFQSRVKKSSWLLTQMWMLDPSGSTWNLKDSARNTSLKGHVYHIKRFSNSYKSFLEL